MAHFELQENTLRAQDEVKICFKGSRDWSVINKRSWLATYENMHYRPHLRPGNESPVRSI